ncbi:hypothetical protein AB0N06_17360 [Streptomyces sp. NPDC051020]|uniref:hypothetical protein n=1 Tax=Streptomyces sp. NPDC051020 TaxID=3155409 RepID=UPI00343B67F6
MHTEQQGTGSAVRSRLPLPKSLQPGRVWLPSLGMCRVEPLPGGWLVQVADGPSDGGQGPDDGVTGEPESSSPHRGTGFGQSCTA